MKAKKPNFFILGAPRCGTTSLYKWLSSNPHIFMPSRKEPNYFSTNRPSTHSLQDYEALFADCPHHALALGEASTQYLRCPDAVAGILRYNPQARFIVMVRNPLEMAHSWHSLKLFHGGENVSDFEKAWSLQNARKAGRRIPPCRDPAELIYGEICKLGEQLQQVYRRAPAERVHVVVFDDLKADAAGVYRSVLKFLQVPDDPDYRPDFTVHNAAKTVPRRPMMRVLKPVFEPLSWLKAAAGLSRPWGVRAFIVQSVMGNQPRPPLPPRVKRMLAGYFHDDVRLLERLIGRDLSHWLEVS